MILKYILDLISSKEEENMIPVISKRETGWNIRILMDKYNLTVKDVQEYLGLGSQQSIYHWLNGISMPTIDNLYALSSLFGVSMPDINRASIPFDKERNGFVMGEGAGMLVLEELEHAKKRGAKIYGEIIGYGATTDAYHITSPCPDGKCSAKAMERAIADAKITSKEIDYINAHGTSTHLNDSTETMAIKTVFKDNINRLMVSSTKSNTGHLLGAAGAVEAILCVKAIEDSIVPPTINYKEKDEQCDLDIVPNELRNAQLNIVMSNSLGFGGHNASIIIKKFEEEK